MIRSAITIGCLLLAAFGFYGCSENGSVSGNAGALQLFLTDKPAQLQEVNVKIAEVEVHETGGPWKSFLQTSRTFDLLKLKNTNELLAVSDLSEGMYTGFRLLIEEGNVIDSEGKRCELKVPSDKIEVPVVFEIEKGALTKVVLDFDAAESVHVVVSGNTQRCTLRPVLKPISVTNS